MSSEDCLPCFPPELERLIFEFAAEFDPKSIPNLLLVSQRVNEWIERVKYSTVTSSGSGGSCRLGALKRAVQSGLKPASFFQDTVRHLFVEHNVLDEDDLREILSTCSGVRSLLVMPFDSSRPALLPSLAAIKPRRLCVVLETIFGTAELIDLSHPMFTSVTHLDLFGIDLQGPWLTLSLLPALTHLSFLDLYNYNVGTELLSKCEKLEVLIRMASNGYASDRSLSIDDVRFVCMVLGYYEYVEDWIIGTQGGMDFWARADAFVAKKRRGEIEPDWRCWIEDGDGI
ncbi:hypothetical protein C8R44DRAFT_774792 [Mycena epipterygia]|nr:hypothetical protein C8R44DRAFT_774792 [Mycena epipterygia]